MKRLVTCILVSLTLAGYAQNQKGIKFTKGLSWAQVREKAKAENKYIFLDTYTTWCLPCKVMEKEIFPQPAVGDFFNANFINVAAQLDVTKRDNAEVKRWYKDAELLQKTYNINSFPTYLFFSPDGELVHKIDGASPTGEEFIEKAKKALDPATQFELLKKQYTAGRKDPEFLLRFIKVAPPARFDPFSKELVNEYLKTQDDLLSQANLKFIADATIRSTDPGFPVLRDHGDKIDAVAGAGISRELMKTIAFDEVGLPFIKEGGRKKYLGGGMISYEGTLKDSVNWQELQTKYEAAYPSLSGELLASTKCEYYRSKEDWAAFADAVAAYHASYPQLVTGDPLDAYCRQLLFFCPAPQALQAALKWSEQNLAASNRTDMSYFYTYGLLLYKTGKKAQAIQVMEEAVKVSGDPHKQFANLLEKIKKGDKMWSN